MKKLTRLTIEIEPGLKRKFKRKAEAEGYKMKGKLVMMMKEYVEALEIAPQGLDN